MKISVNIYFTLLLFSYLFWISLWNITGDIILWGIISLFFFLIFLYCSYYYRQFYLCLLLFLIWSFWGIFYSVSTLQNIRDNFSIIDKYKWQYNSYIGDFVSLHARDDFYDEYIVRLRQINDTNIDTYISHILRVPKNFSLEPGQSFSYRGTLYYFENFNAFNYQRYMLSKRIYFSTSTQVVDILSDEKSWDFYLYSLREKLLWRMRNIFPNEEAIFLWGILLWARESIPSDLKEDFNNSWLTHFIAVSGFNITLCIIFTTFIFGFLPMWGRIFLVSSSIILFSFFVGLWAPVVRASIMWIIWYIFLQSWNTAKNISLLAFTAFLMTLYSPLSLSYDTSFHLSFLAVIGIIYTQDFFKKLFFFVPEFFAIREALVLTLAALSFALPIMVFQFGQVSLLAPFANIAVTWTIPLAMLLWALTLILDFFSPFLWQLVWFITWIFLQYDIFIVRFFGNREFALLQFDFGVYKSYFQALYFVFLIYVVSLYQMKKKKPF